MVGAAEQVREEFVKNDLKYKSFSKLPDGRTIMTAGFRQEQVTFDILFIFESDNRSVYLRVDDLAKVPIDRMYEVLSVLNNLNCQYRWARFYVDKDDEITVQIDHVLVENYSGPVVVELALRIASIVGTGYSEIMKAIWA